MNSHPRYEIIGSIAKGDYATVYRAKDRELDREVAIKQIHQQYLEDPQQLERYWQEAQLLAKLEHPRIMTIYDIVRERGWLVLELMQGSLSQIQNGAAIDLNVLRMALTCGLHALHFLQQNGIIHGDVKPSNLLVDKNNRIKLGDFGIARRMAGDPGSIIKGTTKYMAPEVLSDQFGPVGPHSDLYSLGFSAYELMCGSHFDTLFPGLDMFGRDRQMAWMMWHSSPDRRLPEIKRVLQGVPDDLTFVIQKLVEKDPAKRYRTAEEVIHDLSALSQGGPPGASADEAQAAAEVAKKAKRKRILTFAAFGVSLALCLAILFIPGEKPPDPNANAKPKLVSGVLQDVNAETNVLYVSPQEGAPAEGIPFSRELDSVLLNDRKVDLADLEAGDQLKIKYQRSQDNRETKEISATRAMSVVSTGTIAALDAASATLTISSGERSDALVVHVPHTVRLLLNEDARLGSRALELSDLKTGDQVVVSHVAEGDGRTAQSLHATRRVSLECQVVGVDAAAGKLVVRTGSGASALRKTLTVAKDCEISLNGSSAIDGKLISLADLRTDDRLQLEHDSRVIQIAAFRAFTVEGIVQGTADATSFPVKLQGVEGPLRFSLAPDARIELATTRVPIDLAYLRPGDKVTITHDSPDLKNPKAQSVAVEAVPDKRTWAIVAVEQQYDDPRLAEIPYAGSDGKLLREALAGRYRVPEDQLLYAEGSSRLKLEQDFDRFLKRVAPGSQLIVYYLGHALMTPAGTALLLPKEFDQAKAETSGLVFKSLVEKLEACPAAEKIFLLDVCHAQAGKPAAGQPSSAEIVESLRARGGAKVSNSVTFFASCGKGQTAAVVERAGKQHGAFAWVAAEAFRGRADANKDLRVDSGELHNFVTAQMGEIASATGTPVTPARFLPDATPERITAGGKEAVRKLLAHVTATRVDPRLVTDDILSARELATRQPEVALAYGLVLLKLGKGGEAQTQFESVKTEHPDCSLAHHALAWLHFSQGSLQTGAADLVQLIGSLPPPAKGGDWDPYSVHCQTLAGTLRQYAFKAAASPLTLAQLADLNEEVKILDKAGVDNFVKGLRTVDATLEDLDKRIEAAAGTDKKPLELRRRSLGTYASFDFALAVRYVRESLEK